MNSSSLSHCSPQQSGFGVQPQLSETLSHRTDAAEVITLCFPDIPAELVHVQSPGLTRNSQRHEGLLQLKHDPHLLLPPGSALALNSAIIRSGFKHSDQVLVLNTPMGFWL